ncbi:MAG: hypothetical protein ACI31D_09575, partial [Candidatus Limisoma sp.]
MRQGSTFFFKNCYSLKLNCNEEKFAHICSEKNGSKSESIIYEKEKYLCSDIHWHLRPCLTVM